MTSSAPRTPIKAITNPSLSISSRAPSLPSYSPYLKHALTQKQLKFILPRTALFAWSIVSATAIWQGGDGWIGTILIPFGFKVLLATGFLWVAAIVPVLVGRKEGVGEPRARGTSPLSLLSSAWKQHKPKTTLLIHVFSALSLFAVHIFLAYAFEPQDPKLTIFVKSKKHPFYLSLRTLFLLFSLVPLVVLHTLRTILMRPPFPNSPPSIFAIPLTAFAFALVSLSVTFAVFFVLRFAVFPMVSRTPLLSSLLKPVIGHLFRPRTPILLLPFKHIPLLCRCATLGFVTSFTWLMTTHIVDAALAQKVHTNAPLAALIEGTDAKVAKDGNLLQMYFAYQEIMYRIQTFPGVAEEIFTDQKYQPSLWATILRNSLLFLGERYQETARRGAPPPPPVAPVIPAAPKKELNIGSPVQVLRQRVFKSGKGVSPDGVEKVLDVLASDGPVVDAANQVPELFRSISTAPIPIPKTVKKVTEAVSPPSVRSGFLCALVGRARQNADERLPREVKEWLIAVRRWATIERVGRKVEVGVRGWEGIKEVVDVVSYLTAASLERDPFGTVQRDIPKILEAFTRFLGEVEAWTLELSSLSEKEGEEGEREKGIEVLGEIGDALKEGTALIVRTFGDKLLAFKFPPTVAAKIQGFLDYCPS